MIYTATYSPDDNKLRLSASQRLDDETYQRVKALGFGWAPKQGVFYATWTPGREDLLIELAGEIDDDDKSLIERAEERADRFEEYSDKRGAEAAAAHAQVRKIADGIPFGQPILVGHHSERRARKDAERIQTGMRTAIRLFDTSEYWADRAAAALRHAKYLEKPAVRARRIKTLEAERRKYIREKEHAEEMTRLWSLKDLNHDRALKITNYFDHLSGSFPLDQYPRQLPASQYEGSMSFWSALTEGVITFEQARDLALPRHSRAVAWCNRWIAHYDNRLTYERAMLGEAGGVAADRNKPEKGGACRCWVNRGLWSYIVKVNKVSVTVADNWGNGGENFTRTVPFDGLEALMPAAAVEAARQDGRLIENAAKTAFRLLPKTTPDTPADTDTAPPILSQLDEKDEGAGPKASDIEAMRGTLAAGVKVVVAPQLFPTPAELAARVAKLAYIEPGHRVLEPSAGRAALIRAVYDGRDGLNIDMTAVEINADLAAALQAEPGVSAVHQRDFLACNGDLGTFDRIIMNPPFENGADIAHIRHAVHMLRPGGRLVAICAAGQRQHAAFAESAGYWEVLPPGSFASQGTMANAALVIIHAPSAGRA